MNDIILTLNDVSQEIRKVQAPVSQSMEQRLRNLIEASVAMVTSLNLQQWFERLQQAIAKRQFAEARLDETGNRLREAREELRDLEPARLLKFMVCTTCWLVCSAGEFAITWSTLPFVLNIPEDSALGIAISAVVVAMLTVIEWVIARALEEPYQMTRNSVGTMTRGHRGVTMGLMAAFLALLLAGNLYTVRVLASAREESVKLRQNLEQQNSEGLLEIDQQVIDRAITAVSIAVVIDGSILFLVMIADLKNLDRRLRATLRAATHGRRLPGRERAFLEARAAEAAQQRVWDDREVRIAAVQAEFRERCLFELQTARERTQPGPPAPSTEQLVDRTLSRGMARPAMVEAA